MLSNVPPSLRNDIYKEIFKRVVEQREPFKHCEHGFLQLLVMKLGCVSYMPGEKIFQAHDVGEYCYFLTKGKVSFQAKDGRPLKILDQGHAFGERSLLGPTERNSDCMCLTPCDIVILHHGDVQVRRLCSLA